MSKRITIYDLWSQKGKRKWAQTHIDTDREAKAAFNAGIEIISCEPDHYFPKVREVVPRAFLSVGLKHGTVSSEQEDGRIVYFRLNKNGWRFLNELSQFRI